MTMGRLTCCAIVLFCLSPFYGTDYDHSPTIGPARGWLVVHGGGTVTKAVRERFIRLAGGPEANLVVIPTALPDEEIDTDKIWRQYSRWSPHVTVLHTRSKQRANSSDFVEPLKHASAVWIEGGRQWRLVDAYLGTAVEKEIKELLSRGGVVGGGSAGATIQGSFLVRGQPGNARNRDGDNTVMMSPGYEAGFGLLQDSAIDQHVIVRHRENDLSPVIALHPRLLGIGIDQEAAIIVHGDSFELMDGHVVIHDGKKHGNENYYILNPGQTFNLKTRIPN